MRVSNAIRAAVRWASFRRKRFARGVPRPALEIGPFDKPKLLGAGVSYFDVLDQAGLQERARTMPHLTPAACPFIDFVSPTGDLRTVDRRFASVFSSHLIEHQPDLIGHLNDVAALLEPGGAYYLIVPDKRYCFDHFRRCSTLADVMQAKGRRIHVEATIRRHYRGFTHNNPVRHWLGLHGRQRDADLTGLIEQARAGHYVDCHAWQFTPDSFASIVSQLHAAGETPLAVESVSKTAVGALEFRAVLRLKRDPVVSRRPAFNTPAVRVA